ncbi:hypothetical protein Droror1_Dr00005370 [Drosera rotundifolia]
MATRPEIPRLMLAADKHHHGTRLLYNISDGTIDRIALPPQAAGPSMCFLSSSHGWLLSLSRSLLALSLVNPFSGQKFAMSEDPDGDGCFVAVIHGGMRRLAVCRI